MPEYPQEGVLARRAHPRREERSVEDRGERRLHLQVRGRAGEDLPRRLRVSSDKETIVYCRIGERSSHTWFVLTYLLGLDNVRNYDGSWTEWGNKVGAPIERAA